MIQPQCRQSSSNSWADPVANIGCLNPPGGVVLLRTGNVFDGPRIPGAGAFLSNELVRILLVDAAAIDCGLTGGPGCPLVLRAPTGGGGSG